MNARLLSAAVIGLALVALGCAVQWATPPAAVADLSAGPPSVSFALRPAGPSTAAGANNGPANLVTGLTIVPETAERGADDLSVTLAFEVISRGKRRSGPPPSTSVLCRMSFVPPSSFTPDPSEPYVEAKLLKAMEERINEYSVLNAMADEVHRRTGLAAYAKAVRGMGRPVVIDSGGGTAGWMLAAFGGLVTVFCLGWRGLKWTR